MGWSRHLFPNAVCLYTNGLSIVGCMHMRQIICELTWPPLLPGLLVIDVLPAVYEIMSNSFHSDSVCCI